MTYCGIDLHANNMVNVAINGNGKVVREAKLPTSSRSLEDFFGDLEAPVRAVVECTSSWYWLSDWCRANGVELTLAHAKMVKAISYAKVKTDKVDAKTLSRQPSGCERTLFRRRIKSNMTGGSCGSSPEVGCG